MNNNGSRDGGPHADIRSQIIACVHEGRKIEAIKLLREATGLGLKEAKDEIDRLFAEHAAPEGAGAPEAVRAKGGGCLILVGVLVVAGLLLVL